jgi:hypothetical protein
MIFGRTRWKFDKRASINCCTDLEGLMATKPTENKPSQKQATSQVIDRLERHGLSDMSRIDVSDCHVPVRLGYSFLAARCTPVSNPRRECSHIRRKICVSWFAVAVGVRATSEPIAFVVLMGYGHHTTVSS